MSEVVLIVGAGEGLSASLARRFAREGAAAVCYGASMYRPEKNPPVITIRNGTD